MRPEDDHGAVGGEYFLIDVGRSSGGTAVKIDLKTGTSEGTGDIIYEGGIFVAKVKAGQLVNDDRSGSIILYSVPFI